MTHDTFHGFEDESQSLNQYAYCYNNPIMYVDPSGNVPVFVLNILFNAGTGALGGVIAYFLDIAITGKSFSWWNMFKSATYGAASNAVLGFFGAPKSTIGKIILGAGKGMIAGWTIGKLEKMGVNDFINNVALSAVIGAATELLSYKSTKAKYEFYKMKKSIRNFEQFRYALRKAAQG